MRSPIIAVTAVTILVLLMMTIPGAEADTPARLYFFDADNICIAEITLLPGEPLNPVDVPDHGSYKAWYDDHGIHVNGGRTFSSGDYIIKPYDIDNPPPKRTDEEPAKAIDYPIIILACAVLCLGALVGYLYIKR